MAVELDHYQTIVNVHWPSASDYIAIAIRLISSSGVQVGDQPCGGEDPADPGYDYYGSASHEEQTYNYELYDQALYSDGEWVRAYDDIVISGVRTTDTITASASWFSYPPDGPVFNTFSRFAPRETESSAITIPFNEPYRFGGVDSLIAEHLSGIYVGHLGCTFNVGVGGFIKYKAIDPAPVPVFQTTDLAPAVSVTYFGAALTLIGVATQRATPTPWDFTPPGGTVNRPRIAWLLYRV